jgi:hypothetical protein
MISDICVGRILHASFPEVDSLDPVSYVSELGDPVQALLYSRLFWPKLVEFRGAVFVALWGDDYEYIDHRMHSPAAGKDWPPMSWADAVDSFNAFEVQHIFRQVRGPVEFYEEAHLQLGLILVQAWRARLAQEYPERQFSVEFINGDEVMDSRMAVSQTYPSLIPPEGWSDEQRRIVGDGKAR